MMAACRSLRSASAQGWVRHLQPPREHLEHPWGQQPVEGDAAESAQLCFPSGGKWYLVPRGSEAQASTSEGMRKDAPAHPSPGPAREGRDGAEGCTFPETQGTTAGGVKVPKEQSPPVQSCT